MQRPETPTVFKTVYIIYTYNTYFVTNRVYHTRYLIDGIYK